MIPDGQPNRCNPIRESFVMSTFNQNVRWGELRVLRSIIENELGKEVKHIGGSL